MNRLIMMRLITRHIALSNQQLHTSIRLLNSNDSSSSSDSSDSDNEKLTENREKSISNDNEKSRQQTVDLLNDLLAKMSMDESKPKTMDRAIPKRKILPKPIPEPTLEDKLMSAAKDAADSLGGDTKKTEAELLDKIFSAGAPTSSASDNSATSSTTSPQSSLSDLFAGMEIDRAPINKSYSPEGVQLSRTARVQELARKFQNIDTHFENTKYSSPGEECSPGNLYGGQPLNIFKPVTETSDDEPKLETWELLEKKEFSLMILHPPKNIFEEMIQWTDKGLLWKFPIDNEIGMDEEQNIHFSEHVFMDRHLRGWCPQKGPIRHFMDLVCVGLSKNPYMTVQEKKNHIMWYRGFFGSKQELLKEIGAIQNDILPSNTKQIKS